MMKTTNFFCNLNPFHYKNKAISTVIYYLEQDDKQDIINEELASYLPSKIVDWDFIHKQIITEVLAEIICSEKKFEEGISINQEKWEAYAHLLCVCVSQIADIIDESNEELYVRIVEWLGCEKCYEIAESIEVMIDHFEDICENDDLIKRFNEAIMKEENE